VTVPLPNNTAHNDTNITTATISALLTIIFQFPVSFLSTPVLGMNPWECSTFLQTGCRYCNPISSIKALKKIQSNDHN